MGSSSSSGPSKPSELDKTMCQNFVDRAVNDKDCPDYLKKLLQRKCSQEKVYTKNDVTKCWALQEVHHEFEMDRLKKTQFIDINKYFF